MKATGTILEVGEVKVSGNENQYQDRNVLVDCTFDYQGQVFKNILEFSFRGDTNVKKVEPFKVGDRVNIEYAPQGFRYEKEETVEGTKQTVVKHFQYLNAWDIATVPAADAVPAKA